MPEHLSTALNLSQNAAAQGLGIGLIIVLVAAGIGFLVFFFVALVSIVGTDIGCGAKILWLLVVFCLPFLGSLLWFVVGRPARER
ncbi:PLD nuclease N-terminal domain-containing protein [Amycolatopsis sp. CA-230715]|uniref:PLD nuclease N-terminal domain-containing protein n=1 Tax=Amycolatopsis sp. CA-230715 TaxID=2745196 RepID=UPI001C00DB4C|nr:PLD nuclease N-terminal domain-containing protein [Amycolatopsis sp. CA-230715]QWF77860.1 hypothetical protein HUW46_01253 [Amycolatopsis sp. CA-230715]